MFRTAITFQEKQVEVLWEVVNDRGHNIVDIIAASWPEREFTEDELDIHNHDLGALVEPTLENPARNYVAAILVDGEIVDAYDGENTFEAVTAALNFFMTEKLAQAKIVCHHKETERVVESFTIENHN